MMHAITAEALTKSVGDTRALDALDLAVPPATVLGLLGPNGAGKTTTVRILATLQRPDAGRATVCGYDVVAQAHLVRCAIGLTGQYAALDERLTGVDNLRIIARLFGLSGRDARRRADNLIDQFGLIEESRRPVRTYSGGMRRRLDLAASLVGRPRVLFLDEPSTGLDPRSRNELWSMVRGLVADGTTVLLTTQYLEEADQLADEIVIIDRGRTIARGSSEELKASVARVMAVRPVDQRDVPRTAAILERFARAVPAVEGGVVTVAVSDHATLPLAVRYLDAEGVAVAELLLRAATLDEVFLRLTGAGTGENEVVPV